MERGSSTGLAMIVGGLVVIVVLFVVFGGVDMVRPGGSGGAPDLDVNIEAPAAPAPEAS